MPVRALGAPHTTETMPSPVSTCADAQPVGVRVLHRLDHVGDAERRQRGAAVLHAFQFQADPVSVVGDLGRAASVSRWVFSQERVNFIAHTPSCSIAGASGLKP